MAPTRVARDIVGFTFLQLPVQARLVLWLLWLTLAYVPPVPVIP